jgi:predicted nuclease of predicted toxin-antitoxin system
MKLLADENVPLSIIRALEEDGYDIRCIRLDAPGISDIEVMRYAHKDKRVILTFDLDLKRTCRQGPGVPFSRNYSVAPPPDEPTSYGRIHKGCHRFTE